MKYLHTNSDTTVPTAHVVKLWINAHKLWIMYTVVVLILLVVGPVVYANASTKSSRYAYQDIAAHRVPHKPVAIVFGAGVLPNGEPTGYLKARVKTAVELYKAGVVKKLLLTGDNSTSHHNEPIAMGRYAESLGMPSQDIVLDYAGFNTYDSCYRAHTIFGVNQAVLVSHGYHLPRAIMACRGTGVQGIGVSAKTGGSFSKNYYIREVASTDKAVLQLLAKPKPTVLGVREPIVL